MEKLIFKLRPACKDYIWGGDRLTRLWGKDSPYPKTAETWELSAHKDGLSVIDGGPMHGKTLKEVLTPELLGGGLNSLPVLIKLIDAEQNLSVQVHPDDAYARAHEDDNGKTEMWYIADAEPGSGIYCGFKRTISKEEFLRRIADNSLEEVLDFIPVKKGDSFYIAAGTVHAIGAGLTICEVQQSSNVTYRIYDYGRLGADGNPRPLHTEKAAEVSRLEPYQNFPVRELESGAVSVRLLADCPYFKVSEYRCGAAGAFRVGDGFAAVNVLDGEGSLCGRPAKRGDSFFLPAGLGDADFSGDMLFLLTTA